MSLQFTLNALAMRYPWPSLPLMLQFYNFFKELQSLYKAPPLKNTRTQTAKVYCCQFMNALYKSFDHYLCMRSKTVPS